VRRPLFAAPVLVCLAALGLAGCGSSSSPSKPEAAHGMVSGARCAANRAAGRITYVTGFGYQADAGILDVIAAKTDGYYADECLSVVIRSGTGDPGSTAELVAAGRATLAEIGAPSDAMTVAASGVKVTAVATYGNVPAITLLTNPDITNLRQLEGKTLGYKGSMPPQITAMLRKAGVDVHKIREVGVGYDPTILPRGQVQALTAYKSNEPVELRDDGDKFTEWDPDRFGIKGSFNVVVANQGFAHAHPDAVEDFLRATFHAFAGCVAHPSPCVVAAAKLQSGYDVHQNLQEWTLQSKEVLTSLLPGHGLGAESVAQWTPEADLLTTYHLVAKRPDITTLIDPSFVASIERGRTVSWPGP
jgi:ABC-type nitrate/sulfonate/bicarbonate transport system substrate-binding protein